MKNQGIFLEYPICGNQLGQSSGFKKHELTTKVEVVRNKNGTKPAQQEIKCLALIPEAYERSSA